MTCKFASSGCNVPEGECIGSCMDEKSIEKIGYLSMPIPLGDPHNGVPSSAAQLVADKKNGKVKVRILHVLEARK